MDRFIRVVGGIALVAVGLAALGGAGASVLGIVVAAFGGWLVLTGAVGFCPLYVPFRIDTNKKAHVKSHVATAH